MCMYSYIVSKETSREADADTPSYSLRYNKHCRQVFPVTIRF